MILDDVVDEPLRVPNALVFVVVDWPVQLFTLQVEVAADRERGDHRVLDRKHESAAANEP